MNTLKEEVNAIKKRLAEGYSCCMKMPDPKGGWPLKFGTIYPAKPYTIYDNDSLGSFETFDSIEQMYEKGWIVD